MKLGDTVRHKNLGYVGIVTRVVETKPFEQYDVRFWIEREKTYTDYLLMKAYTVERLEVSDNTVHEFDEVERDRIYTDMALLTSDEEWFQSLNYSKKVEGLG